MRRMWCGLIVVLLVPVATGCVTSDRLRGSGTPPQRDVHGQIEKPGEGSVEVSLFRF